jgi:O-antigen/teichoic acid export membrane protein
VKWNFGSQALQQAAQLVVIAVLARLLSPADFGLVGMATVVIGFLNLFKDLGTSAAVIQDTQITDELLSTVFWANGALGVLGTAALALAAPWVALYYHEPRVTAVLRTLALGFVVSALTILQQALFERKLAFRVLATVEVAAVMCGALVGIGSALAGAGVWSLVAQSLTTVVVVSVILWNVSDWRPGFVFHWSEIRRITSYSLHLSGFNVLNYFCRNADYLLIGRFLGATSLGIYTLAYRIMLYPLQTITTVIGRVMFPVYSRMQDDDARFRSAYLRSIGLIALVTFPMMIGLWAVAGPFVQATFGAKWAPAILLIKILAPVGMAQSIGATVGAIYQAKGRTDVLFRWGLVSGLIVVAAFGVGLRWGIVGVATAYAIAAVVLVTPCFAIPFRFVGLQLKDLVPILYRPLASALIMLGAVLSIRMVFVGHSDLMTLQVLVATGAIAYLIASEFLNRMQLRQAFTLMINKQT